MSSAIKINPKLDLVLERTVDVPVDLVWAAWTQAQHLKKWFVPKPWSIAEAEVDLRPGGTFRTVMRSPEGELHDNAGCYLEVVDQQRLVWTSALAPGFRPVYQANNGPGLLFTGIILLEPHGAGTKYTAIALHGDEASRKTHDEMGFADGWATCLDQLVACIKAGEIA